MKSKLLVSLMAATLSLASVSAIAETNIGSQDFIWKGVVPTVDFNDVYDIVELEGTDFAEGVLEFKNGEDGIEYVGSSAMKFKVVKINDDETKTDVDYKFTLQTNKYSTVDVGDAQTTAILDATVFDVQDANTVLKVGNEIAKGAGDETSLTVVAANPSLDFDSILKAGQTVQVVSTLFISEADI